MNILVMLLKQYIKPGVTKFWREILIVILSGFIWYQNSVETRFIFFIDTIPYLEKQLDIQKENLKICKDGNDTLAADIDNRNAEILKWKEISDDLEKRNKQLVQQQKEVQAATDKQVQDILNEKAPKTCESAMDYLRNGAKDLSW